MEIKAEESKGATPPFWSASDLVALVIEDLKKLDLNPHAKRRWCRHSDLGKLKCWRRRAPANAMTQSIVAFDDERRSGRPKPWRLGLGESKALIFFLFLPFVVSFLLFRKKTHLFFFFFSFLVILFFLSVYSLFQSREISEELNGDSAVV